MVNLKINGKDVSVPAGTTILDAARKAGIRIPTLCYLRDINAIGACRVCVVEVKGARSLVASCVYPVAEGMEVTTNSKRVLSSRKTTVELLLSDHNQDCLHCVRSGNCELQTLSTEMGCESGKFSGETNKFDIDFSTPYLVRDNNKCILCRRCVAACKYYQGVSVIGANSRGFDTHIGCSFEKNLSEVDCVACGQCINVCPTGALREREEIDDVIAALNDPSKYVIFGTAPATRVGIGEEFGYPVGSNCQGKMVAAIKALGADEVFDVDFTAYGIFEQSQGRRSTSHDDQLFARMDQVRGTQLSRAYPQSFHLQISATDVRSDSQDLLCRKDRKGSQRHSCGKRNALYS